MKIVTVPNQVLSSPTISVTEIDSNIKKIVADMEKVLIAQDDPPCVGLAANQVGLDLSIFLVKPTEKSKTKIFACGPNAMLRALSKFTIANGFDCEISTESVMACGFGICQGCNVEGANSENFFLICKDGPVFKAEDVKL